MTPRILTRGRTEEAKARRRIHGDIGAKFSQDKQWTTRKDGISNTLTSCLKDNLLLVAHQTSNPARIHRDHPH